jgi:hypothetical protein
MPVSVSALSGTWRYDRHADVWFGPGVFLRHLDILCSLSQSLGFLSRLFRTIHDMVSFVNDCCAGLA